MSKGPLSGPLCTACKVNRVEKHEMPALPWPPVCVDCQKANQWRPVALGEERGGGNA